MSSNSDEPKNNSGVKFTKMQGMGPLSWVPLPSLPIFRYAEELRKRITSQVLTGTASDFLTAPLPDCDLGDEPAIPLLSWLFFDRSHPKVGTLFCTPVPDSDLGILMCRRMDPFTEPRHMAFGMVPLASDLNDIKDASLALFRNNGHSRLRLFGSLPTAIFHSENWPAKRPPSFDPELARSLFRSIAAQVWPGSMRAICDILGRHKDPWERTLAESRENIRHKPDSLENSRVDFDERVYGEWFDLVSEESHAALEHQNIHMAFEYAINSVKMHQFTLN